MADAVPLSGSIDPRTFPYLLVQLHRSGATGSFKVEGPSYQKALYIRAGRILFGSSNDPRDQLGAILIESGRITPEQLDDVNARVGPGNPLAKVLADTGYVSQRELSEAARAKVERIFSDVIAYDTGSFEFEDGVLPKGAVDLKLNTERLIVSAIRRVPDRAFVLRHLGSVNAVMLPSAGLAALLPEIHAEVGRLPEQLDGSTTLKEAAAGAALDEFDAAKIACALLFLGAIELQGPSGNEPAADEAAPSFIGDDEPIVMADPGPPPGQAPPVVDTPSSAGEDLISFGSDEDAPNIGFAGGGAPSFAAGDEPPIFTPDAEAAPPREEPPAVSFAPEPEPERTPPPPAAAAAEPVSPMRIEPERPARPARAEIPIYPPPSAPPTRGERRASATREDLAAVDALLHSRTPEGPMAPLDTGHDRWTPRFGTRPESVRGRRDVEDGGRRTKVLAGIALLLLAGGAGAWWWLITQRGVPFTAPSAAPSAAATPRPAPPTTAATPEPVDPRALLRQGRHDAAAQAFVDELRAAGPGAATIQLLIACSTDTVDKALANTSETDLVVLPTTYQGRSCYRLCWGIHASAADAAAAVRQVPDYFTRGGARPRVVGAREALP